MMPHLLFPALAWLLTPCLLCPPASVPRRYQMALWDVGLAGGQALGADGSVLGVPVTLLVRRRAAWGNGGGWLSGCVPAATSIPPCLPDPT